MSSLQRQFHSDFGSRVGWLPRFARRWSLRTLSTPIVALGLLGFVGYAHHTSHDPTSWDQFHDSARNAIEALPTQVSGASGEWIGREVKVPEPAMQLLRPNALRNLVFTDYSPRSLRARRQVSLLIVQCRSANDMLGHYPPECYPAQGAREVAAYPRQWEIPALDPSEPPLRVSGMEYHFAEPDRQGRLDMLTSSDRADQSERLLGGRRRVVLNFLIVPGEGVVPDMHNVFASSEDFQKRRRGAAQVQIVFGPRGPIPGEAQRDAIFRDLLSPAVPALRTLIDRPELRPAPDSLAGDDAPGPSLADRGK